MLCLDFHCPIQFLLVSIAISSIFPFKLYFIDSCGLQDHFFPYQFLLCDLTCCPYLTALNSIYSLLHPKSSGLQLQLSPRHLHIDVPLSSNATDWDSASCLSSQANALCLSLLVYRAQTCLAMLWFHLLLPPHVSLLPRDLHSLLPSASNMRFAFSFLGGTS